MITAFHMKDLSIIIPSYNTKEITSKCIESLLKNLSSASLTYEVLVVDNASVDGSKELLEKITQGNNANIKAIFLKNNLGYSKANNRALNQSQGRYVLFLNSDVLIENVNFDDIIKYMDSTPDVGALTVRVNLQSGNIDPASHRGFPTLWRSLCYFSGMEKLFGTVPVMNGFLGGYHLLDRDLNKLHEIDTPSGAFFLIRKEITDKLKGFDEDFFIYGEDIDLSYRIKKLGYRIIYYPMHSVLHLKYKSGLKNKNTTVRNVIHDHFYDAMKIFYKKHYQEKYPSFINGIVYFLIDFKKKTA